MLRKNIKTNIHPFFCLWDRICTAVPIVLRNIGTLLEATIGVLQNVPDAESEAVQSPLLAEFL